VRSAIQTSACRKPGRRSRFQEPVRRRIHGIETFNALRGGEYFFMPSLSALKWLGDLSTAKADRVIHSQMKPT
jgi:hypothetical protein